MEARQAHARAAPTGPARGRPNGGDTGEVLGVDRRKLLLTLGGALVLGVGALGLLGRAADYGRVLDALAGADRRWLPVCLLGQVLAYTGYVAGYREVARAEGGPVFRIPIAIRIVSVSFGAYVLGAGAGGLAVDFWALNRAGEEPHSAARRVLGLNTVKWLVLGSFAALASVAVLAGAGEGAPLGMTLGWLVALPLAILLAAWIGTPERAERLATLPAGARSAGRDEGPEPWIRSAAGYLRKGLADVVGGAAFVRRLLARRLEHAAAFAGFGLYWLGDLLTLAAALRAFGIDVGPAPLVVAYATGYVIVATPLPAGAAGFAEASLALALSLVGVPLAEAVLASFVYRFFTLWLPIMPALVVLPGIRGLADEIAEAPRERGG